jgi:signal transduction histidine kinase
MLLPAGMRLLIEEVSEIRTHIDDALMEWLMENARMEIPISSRKIANLKTTAFIVVMFILGYIALDWTSYIAPLKGLNVTAWNPAPALGLLFVLRGGRLGAPALFIAIVLSDVVNRGTPGSLAVTMVVDGVLTLGYVVIAHVLKRRFPEGGVFIDRTGLLIWTGVVISGSLLNSLVFISALYLSGLIEMAEWGNALLKFWVGDAVGIYVTMPLFWWLADPMRRYAFVDSLAKLETLAYLFLVGITLWVSFDLGAEAGYRYFYVLFLPVVWAASRQGVTGSVISATAIQLGLILAGTMYEPEGISLFEVQIRAFLVALVAFLIGVAVDDHRRALSELNQSLRLAAAGEMAAALAHELNQPLAALSAYGAACDLMVKQKTEPEKLHETIRRMVGEANRAANVVSRLRDFFRNGAIQMEEIALTDLVGSAISQFEDKTRQLDINLSVSAIPDDIVLVGDRLQLEVVFRNLLANACDAVAEADNQNRKVHVEVCRESGSRISIVFEDNGPGIDGSIAGKIFEPFVTNKSSGLGLGLAISRAIVEAHGGTLLSESVEHGVFRLMLPTENIRKA